MRTRTLAMCLLTICGALAAQDRPILPDKPNELAFKPVEAKIVRMAIYSSSQGGACIDELEVYDEGGKANLALASGGAKATASSCISGYDIHKVSHLNDGRYGNSHSWVAADELPQWVQIELSRPARMAKVVISRDRQGRYSDRVPQEFDVQVSLDGKRWTKVYSRLRPGKPSRTASEEEVLRYAFSCEAASWSRIQRDPLDFAIGQFKDMIDRFAGAKVDVAAERVQLRGLLERRQATADSDEGVRETLLYDIRLAKRRLFFRDSDLAPLRKILFVKRHPFLPSHNYSDLLDPAGPPGGAICVLEIPFEGGRLAPGKAKVADLFKTQQGVPRDPAASFDTKTIYFGYRTTKSDYYRIMSMNADGSGLKQLTDGPFHDFYPCPLPDGGLATVSTRCRARFLCWRPQTYVLFRMDSGGGNIRPLSFANLSEWAPTVRNDGTILWTRSEYLDKGADFGHTLWSIRPDGTHPELVFGNNTRNCYMNGREVPGTSELCCTLISHGGDLNGPIAYIDTAKNPSDASAITNITPDVAPHYHMSWARSSCFRDPVPISRDKVLVSHAPEEHFGLYVIDRYGNRELLYMDMGIGSMCPTPLAPRTPPPALAPQVSADADAPGQLLVSDVYRGLEPTVKRGQVKYIRICQEVRSNLIQLPDGSYQSDHPDFQDWYAGPTHLVQGPFGWPSYVAKGVVGIVPVEADGSANFTAPAGKVLYFQALDVNFNELQRMRSVMQLQPGEKRSCVGCHETRSDAAAAPRMGSAFRRPASAPQSPSWGAGPFAYEKVVQPVWDAQCVRCHNATHKGGIDLSGTAAADKVPASYRTLIAKGLVQHFDYTWGREHDKAAPMSFGTLKSKLWNVLNGGHKGVTLTGDQVQRVKCWIDLNCPLWPDYQYRPDRPVAKK